MSLQKTLKNFQKALTELPVSVFHYDRGRAGAPYLVWQEDQEGDSFIANNRKKEPVITGSMDYFTAEDFDENVDRIQELLERVTDGWSLESVQYEQETKLMHFSWSWGLKYGL